MTTRAELAETETRVDIVDTNGDVYGHMCFVYHNSACAPLPWGVVVPLFHGSLR